MNRLGNLAVRAARRLRRFALGLPPKQFNEREFWREEFEHIHRWNTGQLASLYGIPCPQRGDGYNCSRKTSAIEWAKCQTEIAQIYASRLFMKRERLHGMRVLEIGPGPFAPSLTFSGCEIWGVEPLAGHYRSLGYPIDEYDDRMHYLEMTAEAIDKPDGWFDAVISVNAIDHVDSFSVAAREISRVCKPGAFFRMEVHYHSATSCEPVELSDEIFLKHFGHFNIRKFADRPLTEVSPNATRFEERVVVWGNAE